MAEKTYTVVAGRFGYVKNRDQVEKGALEGRTVPPIAEYLERGAEVKLDSDHPYTKKALASGSIEEPGASAKREREQVEARLEELKAEQARLAEQAQSASKSGG